MSTLTPADMSRTEVTPHDLEGGVTVGPPSSGSITISYRVNHSVDVDAVSSSGKTKRGKVSKVILDDVCGVVQPGDLLAIMGPSGAGKTTLLNCLSLRNNRFKGYVLHNGKVPSMEMVGTSTAFVQQEDLFIPSLTPREHLEFHAVLRIRGSLNKEDRQKAVEKSLVGLGLGKCADTPIGGQDSSMRGISGGEKKRLSLATEVLGDSSILFADEPTSGLDSFMAEAVVAKLKALAESGRTVVATIHQPSSQVFSMFTHLHLLAEGKTCYFGPLIKATRHFEEVGLPCPNYYNPADHYIRVLSRDPQNLSESNIRIQAAAAAFNESQSGKELLASLPTEMDVSAQQQTSEKSSTLDDHVQGKHGKQRRAYAASWLTQVREIYIRTLRMYKREPVLTRVRLAQAVVVGLIVGLIYLQLGNSQADVQSTMGVLFFVVINQAILGTIGVLQVFPLEMPIFLREFDSVTYRVDTYYFGRTLAEIPIQIIFPAIFAAIVAPLVGLPLNATPFLLFIVAVVMTANAAVSMGYMISALAKNVSVALAVGPLLLLPCIIFGGLLINIDEIPEYFVWLSSLSFVQYGYAAASIAVWREKPNLDCPPEPAPCPFPSGDAVLEYLNFDKTTLGTQFFALLALIVGFRILAYLALVYRSRPSAKKGY